MEKWWSDFALSRVGEGILHDLLELIGPLPFASIAMMVLCLLFTLIYCKSKVGFFRFLASVTGLFSVWNAVCWPFLQDPILDGNALIVTVAFLCVAVCLILYIVAMWYCRRMAKVKKLGKCLGNTATDDVQRQEMETELKTAKAAKLPLLLITVFVLALIPAWFVEWPLAVIAVVCAIFAHKNMTMKAAAWVMTIALTGALVYSLVTSRDDFTIMFALAKLPCALLLFIHCARTHVVRKPEPAMVPVQVIAAAQPVQAPTVIYVQQPVAEAVQPAAATADEQAVRSEQPATAPAVMTQAPQAVQQQSVSQNAAPVENKVSLGEKLKRWPWLLIMAAVFAVVSSQNMMLMFLSLPAVGLAFLAGKSASARNAAALLNAMAFVVSISRLHVASLYGAPLPILLAVMSVAGCVCLLIYFKSEYAAMPEAFGNWCNKQREMQETRRQKKVEQALAMAQSGYAVIKPVETSAFFTNCGKKFKVIAKVMCYLGFVGSAICGIAMMVNGDDWIAIGLIIAVFGGVVVWLVSLIPYAIGTIVENSEIQTNIALRQLKEDTKE